jgi:hypothetical protein
LNEGYKETEDDKQFLENWVNSKRFKTKLVENLKEIDSLKDDPKYKGWLDERLNDPNADAEKMRIEFLKKLNDVKVYSNPNYKNYNILSDEYSKINKEDEDEKWSRENLVKGQYTPYNHSIWLNTSSNNIATHELTHSTDFDKLLIPIIPNSEKYDKIIKEYSKDYPKNAGLKIGYNWFDPVLYDQDDNIILRGEELKNDFEKRGEYFSDLSYLNKSLEVYPRIMGIRRSANLDPNEVITKERMEEIYKLTKNDDLYLYYSKDQVRDLLNKLADNSKNKTEEYPIAKKGGNVGINQLDAQPMKKLNQLLNFTNNPDKDNWLDKYN